MATEVEMAAIEAPVPYEIRDEIRSNLQRIAEDAYFLGENNDLLQIVDFQRTARRYLEELASRLVSVGLLSEKDDLVQSLRHASYRIADLVVDLRAESLGKANSRLSLDPPSGLCRNRNGYTRSAL
jgi:hypothetical protein